MLLAEALILRADLQRRLDRLKTRVRQNAVIQEGDRVSEDPNDLLAEHDAASEELMGLVVRINQTNACVTVGDETMTAALARRDRIRNRLTLIRDAAEWAQPARTVQTRSEVRFRATMPIAALQKTADSLARAGESH